MVNGIRASIDLIAFPWHPSNDEATMRSQYETLTSLGLNAFMGGYGNWAIENWNKGKGVEIAIDRVYNIAAEYGIRVYWYTSAHRLPWTNPNTDPPNQTFVGRYKNFAACAGWLYGDEPALNHWPHQQTKDAYNKVKSMDPNHPAFPIWSADLETDHYMLTMHPAWGDLYDLSCTDIYPQARAGANWATELANRSNLTYRYTGKSPYWGFEHWQPRDHIAVIQAFVEGGMPDIVGQYNVLKNGLGGWAGWGDRLIGIGFWHPAHFLFATGVDAENLRNQIKDLARLLGWQERPDEVITPPPIEEPVTPPVEEPEVITPPVEKPVGPATEHQITCPQCRSVSTVFECLITEPGAYCPISEFPLQDCPICGYKIVERAKKIEVIEAKPWPPIEEADSLSQLDDITTPTGSPVQESEMKRQAMIMQLEPIPIMAPIEIPITEKPLILAEVEPLKEKILSLDWLKNNWHWVGVGLVGLTLIITLAKD